MHAGVSVFRDMRSFHWLKAAAKLLLLLLPAQCKHALLYLLALSFRLMR
jgi:hypothetical protein